MLPYQIIEKKSKGKELSNEEIIFFIDCFTNGSIPDYQMSALLMAMFIKGMTTEETLALTKTMLESGERMDFSHLDGFVADKHSTGGVGDKVSLILAPILGALGVHIPMISGRGLGHTGGTLDKLESIPGFNVNLSNEQFKSMVENDFVSLIGQTGNICPADKKLYALRDVTATVRSIPLITASIMSKKIAEGINGLVLDVKVGNGAFMTAYKDAQKLAESLVSVGKQYGIKTVALLTDMNQPLGNAIGNWLEVEECIECLKGKGPEDLMDVTLALGAEILKMRDPKLLMEDAIKMQMDVLESGTAMDLFVKITKIQGGDVSVLLDPKTRGESPAKMDVIANQDGYFESVRTMDLGFAAIELGAGRKTMTDEIDPLSGFIIHKKLGDKIARGDVMMTIYAKDEKLAQAVHEKVKDYFYFTDKAIDETYPHIYEIIN
jgi:pyrimidine-nucleoside phosphorylase